MNERYTKLDEALSNWEAVLKENEKVVQELMMRIKAGQNGS